MSAIGVSSCLVPAYFLCVVVVGCWGMPTSGTCSSPVDLVSRHVVGPATLHLPTQARHLQVRVIAEKSERAGVVVLRLWPVDVDEARCTAVGEGAIICYKYSEIRWGLAGGNGSDHSLDGRTSKLELQHYLRRSDGELLGTPLALAVLASPNNHRHHHTPRSMVDLVKLVGNETTSMNLTLGDLLPLEGQPYYQYSGTVPGLCREETEWLVYDGEMDTPRELLECLRRHWVQQGEQAHFSTVNLASDILYSERSVVPKVASISSRTVDEDDDHLHSQEIVVSTNTTVTTAARSMDEATVTAVKPNVTSEASQGTRQATETLVGTLRGLKALEDGIGSPTDMEGHPDGEATGVLEDEERHSDEEMGAPADEETHPEVTGVHSDAMLPKESGRHSNKETLLDVQATGAPSDETSRVTEATGTHLDVETLEPDMEDLPGVVAAEASRGAGGLPDAAEAPSDAAEAPSDAAETEAVLDAEAPSDAAVTEAIQDTEAAVLDAEAPSDAAVTEAIQDTEAAVLDAEAPSDAAVTEAIQDTEAAVLDAEAPSDAAVTEAIQDTEAAILDAEAPSDAAVTEAIQDTEAAVLDAEAPSDAETVIPDVVVEAIPDAEAQLGAFPRPEAHVDNSTLASPPEVTSLAPGRNASLSVSSTDTVAPTLPPQTLVNPTTGGTTAAAATTIGATTTDKAAATTTEEPSSGPLLKPQDLMLLVMVVVIFLV